MKKRIKMVFPNINFLVYVLCTQIRYHELIKFMASENNRAIFMPAPEPRCCSKWSPLSFDDWVWIKIDLFDLWTLWAEMVPFQMLSIRNSCCFFNLCVPLGCCWMVQLASFRKQLLQSVCSNASIFPQKQNRPKSYSWCLLDGRSSKNYEIYWPWVSTFNTIYRYKALSDINF